MPNQHSISQIIISNYRAWIDYCAHWHMSPLPGYEITNTGCWRSMYTPTHGGYISYRREFGGNAYQMRLHVLSLIYAESPAIYARIAIIQAEGNRAVVRHKPICAMDGGNGAGCFNPNHLTLGTAADNVADTIRDGNQRRGSDVANAKLTEAQVAAIRQEHSDGTMRPALARKYGVSVSQIGKIVRRQQWAYSDGKLFSEPSIRGLDNRFKLTNDEVNAIREQHASGKFTMRALALRYGVSVAQIHNIVHMKSRQDCHRAIILRQPM